MAAAAGRGGLPQPAASHKRTSGARSPERRSRSGACSRRPVQQVRTFDAHGPQRTGSTAIQDGAKTRDPPYPGLPWQRFKAIESLRCGCTGPLRRYFAQPRPVDGVRGVVQLPKAVALMAGGGGGGGGRGTLLRQGWRRRGEAAWSARVGSVKRVAHRRAEAVSAAACSASASVRLPGGAAHLNLRK